MAEVGKAGVAADAGEDADAEPVEDRQHPPKVPGDVVFADQIDVVVGELLRFGGPDDMLEEHLAGQTVADVLVADETGGIHRNYRHGNLLGRRRADLFQVIADHGGNAGGIDEDRLGLVAGAQVEDGVVELLLPAEDDVVVHDVGGEAAAVELGAGGAGAAIVPGIAGAGNGAVHQVDDVRDRHQDHPRPVVGAAALGPFARLGFFAELGGALFVGLAFGDVVVIPFRHNLALGCRGSAETKEGAPIGGWLAPLP